MRLFTLDRLKKMVQPADAERGWPGYVLGGHVRTSTLVLIVAFGGLWWVYDSNQHSTSSTPTQVPATQVVPPGFVPDPNYTWVPRSRLQQPPATVTRTLAPTTTTITPTTTTETTTTPPPFVLPPPFGPPPSTSTTPVPGPGPTPSTTP